MNRRCFVFSIVASLVLPQALFAKDKDKDKDKNYLVFKDGWILKKDDL